MTAYTLVRTDHGLWEVRDAKGALVITGTEAQCRRWIATEDEKARWQVLGVALGRAIDRL